MRRGRSGGGLGDEQDLPLTDRKVRANAVPFGNRFYRYVIKTRDGVDGFAACDPMLDWLCACLHYWCVGCDGGCDGRLWPCAIKCGCRYCSHIKRLHG